MKNLSAFVVASLISVGALASPISGTDGNGNPVVPGATSTITFDGLPNATFTSLNTGGVTFSGIGGTLRTDNTFAGQYNGRGSRYMDNNQGATNGFRFDFSTPLTGFAFNFGASDIQWTLTAFNANGIAIESTLAPITNGSNAGNYIGLSGSGQNYKYATLTTTGNDYVFIDNFTVAEAATGNVPEPMSLGLMAIGLAGLGFARARKSN